MAAGPILANMAVHQIDAASVVKGSKSEAWGVARVRDPFGRLPRVLAD